MAITEGDILKALETVIDPDLQQSVVAAGMVKEIESSAAGIRVKIELTTPACPMKEQIKSSAVAALRALNGGGGVTVEMTAKVRSRALSSPSPILTQVKHVILVGAGKGGVGKSTVALNLACALARQGALTGLLDADFYGPSIPIMVGVARNPVSVDGKTLEPIEVHGVKVMSIGFLVDAEQAVIWRGPMIHGALTQLLRDVHWGELDYLIVDLPPGTGDVPLSVAQQLATRAWAILVTTPQDVALADVVRAKHMFDKLKIPVLGLVENMSHFACPHCGEVTDIFARGGGRRTASRLGIELLGEIPLELAVREGGDRGLPVVVAEPDSLLAQAFTKVSGRTAAQVSIATRAEPAHV